VEQSTFSENSALSGGAIENASGETSVTSCNFEDNAATMGGAIYTGDMGGGMVSNSTFLRNTAEEEGGAIRTFSESAVYNCTFRENSAGTGGGFMGKAQDMSNCRFLYNQARGAGGGLYLDGGHVFFLNCTVHGNQANQSGGIAAYSVAMFDMLYCTVAGNEAENYGGIFFQDTNPEITNSIIWGNMAPTIPEMGCISSSITVNYSCIGGGFSGSGTLNANPRFVDLETGNLHLLAYSPCIDTGTTTGVSSDIEHSFRPQNAGYDMGAYEFSGMPVPGLSVMPPLLNVETWAGSTRVDIVTPTYWTATSSASWLHIVASGTGNTITFVSYDRNYGPARSGTITITGSGTTPGTETVVVTQEGIPPSEGEGEVIEGELVEGEIEGELPTEGEGEITEGEGEAPVEGEGEAILEGEGEPPVEGEGETPAEGEGEPPVEGEGETPAEGEGETPAEGEGEAPVEGEGEGEAILEGEGEAPAEGEGETPVEGEGEAPVEGEGEVPAEGEGETPAEGEGEAPIEGEGETPAEGEGEIPAEGEGEAPVEGEPVVEGEGETPAEGEGESVEGEEEPGGCCDSGSGAELLPTNLQRRLGDFLLIGISLLCLLTEFGSEKP